MFIYVTTIPINRRNNIRVVYKVVLDAGHGGRDPGALGSNGLKEKNIVLDIAKRVKKILEAKGGYEVHFTRDRDRYLSLEKRTVISNKHNADLFVSIHANANPSSRIRGMETYFLNFASNEQAMKVAARENRISLKRMKKARSEQEAILASLQLQNNRDESLKLANFVQDSMVYSMRKYSRIKDLGVKQALFYVLFGAEMPSVLVEVSYITNPEEAKRLKSGNYRESLAKGIASGVKKYFDSIPPEHKIAMRR